MRRTRHVLLVAGFVAAALLGTTNAVGADEPDGTDLLEAGVPTDLAVTALHRGAAPGPPPAEGGNPIAKVGDPFGDVPAPGGDIDAAQLIHVDSAFFSVRMPQGLGLAQDPWNVRGPTRCTIFGHALASCTAIVFNVRVDGSSRVKYQVGFWSRNGALKSETWKLRNDGTPKERLCQRGDGEWGSRLELRPNDARVYYAAGGPQCVGGGPGRSLSMQTVAFFDPNWATSNQYQVDWTSFTSPVVYRQRCADPRACSDL